MGSPGLCGNAGGELFAATRIPARFASPFATCVCHEDAVDRIASQHCASNNQSGMSATDLPAGWTTTASVFTDTL